METLKESAFADEDRQRAGAGIRHACIFQRCRKRGGSERLCHLRGIEACTRRERETRRLCVTGKITRRNGAAVDRACDGAAQRRVGERVRCVLKPR